MGHADGSGTGMRGLTGIGPAMSVAHISPGSGGVATAVRGLHAGLLREGVRSRLFVSALGRGDLEQQHVYPYPSVSRSLRYGDRLSRYINRRLHLTGLIHVSSLFWAFPHFDVIHVHGMDSNWFNLHALKRFSRRHALVWTMHDKHLGTGACGYPEFWGSCERWRTGCGRCPKAQREGWSIDLTRLVYARKRSIVAQTEMAIVAPSEWMFTFLTSNPITRNHLVRRIPNGVDTDVFSPRPPDAARRELGLPIDGRLLLCVATHLGQPRKGSQYHQPLLADLKSAYQNTSLVLVGNPPTAERLAELRAILPVHVLGLINEPAILAKVYSAADMFVTTPMIDNFPSVVLESMACGTPVAAFRVGGIPDVVIPDRTGTLAELGDTTALASQIDRLLGDRAKVAQMRAYCRQLAVEYYGLDVQAAQYMELYQDLCRRRTARVGQENAGGPGAQRLAHAWAEAPEAHPK